MAVPLPAHVPAPDEPIVDLRTRDVDVETRVRALVRDRGTDPLADPRAVRAAILDVLDEVVAAAPADASYADLAGWADDLQASVGGYGPLQRLFDDPDVEEVWVK